MSPAAIERIERIAASGRYIPETLALKNALDNSRLDQTLNTPALTPLVMMREQARVDERQRRHGVRDGPHRGVRTPHLHMGRCDSIHRDLCHTAFKPVPGGSTVDLLPPVDSAQLRSALRSAGVVDIDPYRKARTQPDPRRHVPLCGS
ncbi:hypothetical protein GCM10025876_13050 [Demequina litorisediminis]|uniref:Anti-sigma-28 factor FlgM C-terminal domain-containing protein n=1 Tax=Demequina litorisediminis TaxID=1849022 RepID=A0ABQ6ICW3_9MICO|nr:hypothetical protein GCM10025876_13050 [Demequina litorisediminis]